MGSNVGVSGELDVSGRLRADRLEVESPNGTTRFDGMHNQIGGDYLDINALMDTNVSEPFKSGSLGSRIAVGTTRFDGMHSQIGGDFLDIYVMDTNVHGELDVYGRFKSIWRSGRF